MPKVTEGCLNEGSPDTWELPHSFRRSLSGQRACAWHAATMVDIAADAEEAAWEFVRVKVLNFAAAAFNLRLFSFLEDGRTSYLSSQALATCRVPCARKVTWTCVHLFLQCKRTWRKRSVTYSSTHTHTLPHHAFSHTSPSKCRSQLSSHRWLPSKSCRRCLAFLTHGSAAFCEVFKMLEPCPVMCPCVPVSHMPQVSGVVTP